MPSVPYRDKKYHRSASLRRTGSSRNRPHWVPLCRLLLRNRMHFTDSGVPARKVPLPRTAAGIRTQSRPVCFFDIIDKKNRSKRFGYSRLFRRLFRDSVFLRIFSRRSRTGRLGTAFDLANHRFACICRSHSIDRPFSLKPIEIIENKRSKKRLALNIKQRLNSPKS